MEFSWGATEVKVPQLADAIVEVTETGASLARQPFAGDGHADGIGALFIANRTRRRTSGSAKRSKIW